jgi:hypothetical protein
MASGDVRSADQNCPPCSFGIARTPASIRLRYGERVCSTIPAVMVMATWGRRRSFLVLALASAVLLLGASWLTFTVGHRMLPP